MTARVNEILPLPYPPSLLILSPRSPRMPLLASRFGSGAEGSWLMKSSLPPENSAHPSFVPVTFLVAMTCASIKVAARERYALRLHQRGEGNAGLLAARGLLLVSPTKDKRETSGRGEGQQQPGSRESSSSSSSREPNE